MIPDRYAEPADIKVQVTYYHVVPSAPIEALGIAQTCSLPWEGPLDATPEYLASEAQLYFDRKYPAAEHGDYNRVVKAWLYVPTTAKA